jgi:hypothetical protein
LISSAKSIRRDCRDWIALEAGWNSRGAEKRGEER